jgi:hypothetical protein
MHPLKETVIQTLILIFLHISGRMQPCNPYGQAALVLQVQINL